ncbi:hypothetical protein CN428_24490 [Bacillus cereus]|nr:hypothetical protein CN428_24490 [Bacillus cereus]
MQLKIPFLLPYKVPVSENEKISFDGNTVSFDTYVHKITYQKTDLLNLPPKTNTIIWITKNFDHREDVNSIENKNEVIKEFVFQGLQFVNFFLDAFRDVSNLDYMKSIDLLDLPNPLPVLVNSEEECMRIEELVTFRHQTDEDIFSNVIDMMNFWACKPEYRLINQHHSQAKASIRQGNYSLAILQLQTTFEIMVRRYLKMSIINEGLKKDKSHEEINEEVRQVDEDRNFKRILQKKLAKYLKTRLDYDTNKYIKNWSDNLYIFRNDIVHAGKQGITKEQVDSAYNSFLQAEKHLSGLQLKNFLTTTGGKIDTKLLKKYFDKKSIKELSEEGFLPKDLPVD